ncbi:hypothetical protein MN116_004234 [Schistosoma mekongi]|uniref:Eukaryotic translation initiation factor 2A n=1 Tax=Schistosoma mekongi TaxID=38744 RepID=A0AAE1ZFE0_SCHME|nr:hypothetical protein MN116_004234 [Schistosoma mekongi]
MVFVSWASDGLRIYEVNDSKEIIQLEHKPSTTLKCLSIAKLSMSMGYLDQTKIVLLNMNDRSIVSTILVESASRIQLSPCGMFGFVYTPFKIDNENPSGSPNIFVYDMINRTKLKEYIFRRGDGWQPQWNSDSSFCSIFVNGEIHIYANNQFSEKPCTKLSLKGIRHFSMSASIQPNLAVYIPGEKNQPSIVRVYQYRDNQLISTANKSFFRADTVRLLWNDKGTDLLILTSTKLSDESYYGDQGLYYISAIRSGDSAIVTMPRKGPIYQIAFQPTNYLSSTNKKNKNKKVEEYFVVCYGFTPASVTIFNLNCEPVHDFGTGSWNEIHFNPHGNLLLLAGLGNLPGDMCVWDFSTHERLSSFKTSDITSVQWLPDGEHLIFATTTPRLRVNNGFGIWHYSGKQLSYRPIERRDVPRPATPDLPAAVDHELYQVSIIYPTKLGPAPVPKKFESFNTIPGNKPASIYIPPILRNRSAVAVQSLKSSNVIDNSKVSDHSSVNHSNCNINMVNTGKISGSNQKITFKSPNESLVETSTTSNSECTHLTASDPKNQKQVNQICKKLTQIEKLKREQASGKILAFNQLDKVSSEKQLRDELAKLCI